MSNCWRAAVSGTPRTSGRSPTPARPARWSPPHCTAARSRHRSCARFGERRDATPSHALEVRHQRRRHVDAGRRLDPVPPRDRVDLEHVVEPVGGAQEVDAGVVDTQRRGRPHAQRRALRVERDRAGAGAAGEVRPPPLADALDRGDQPRADDNPAHVDAGVRHRLLLGVDGPLYLERAEHALGDVAVLDARHAEPHRAEERLDDHVVAEVVEGRERVLGALGCDRPRCRHPGSRDERRGEELVDGALDRERGVDHAHARRDERVQRVDAEDDLLERPARDPADDHDVAALERDVAAADRDAAVDAADHAGHRREGARVPARAERPGDPLGVPAAGRAHHRDAHVQACRPRGGTIRRAPEGSRMRTLLIDNYDSYTFNLFHLLGEVNGEQPVVVRNDEASWDELGALAFDNVVISPGPGRPEHPRDVGLSLDALRRAEVPVLGVCLGHQALAYVAGGTVEHAPEVMHGRLSRIRHDGRGLFAGLPQDFLAVRYHSLVVGAVPDELRVTAWTADDVIMGLEHRTRPLFGVQFHPESVSTTYGRALLQNFRDLTRRNRRGAPPTPAPPTPAPPLAAEPAPPSRVGIRRRALDAWCDPEAVFAALYAEHDHAVWLDSSRTGGSAARF